MSRMSYEGHLHREKMRCEDKKYLYVFTKGLRCESHVCNEKDNLHRLHSGTRYQI